MEVMLLVPSAAAAFLSVAFLMFGCLGIFLGVHAPRPRYLPSDIFFPPKRRYVSWNSINGWPRGATLSYECMNCHKTLFSQPRGETTCGCGNLFIGPERIGAENSASVRLFEE